MPSQLIDPQRDYLEASLIEFLSEWDHPFSDYIHPQRAANSGTRAHISAINEVAVSRIRAVLDRFRLDQDVPSGLSRQVPNSGVLVVFGSRGSGKTHLVQNVLKSSDMNCVVVTPTTLEMHRQFPEFLLHQLVRHLQNTMTNTATMR